MFFLLQSHCDKMDRFGWATKPYEKHPLTSAVVPPTAAELKEQATINRRAAGYAHAGRVLDIAIKSPANRPSKLLLAARDAQAKFAEGVRQGRQRRQRAGA